VPERRKTSRQYTKAQMRAFARDRLFNAPPMRVEHAPDDGSTEVLRISDHEWRLCEKIPAKLEVVQLREPGTGPWRLYRVDGFSTDFTDGGLRSQFDNYADAEAAARTIGVGERCYVDDSEGRTILKVIHHAPATRFPW
jgi:hypothetical protein